MGVVRTTGALLALILVAAGADAKAPLFPLVVEWDRYFSVDVSTATRDGSTLGSVTVRNISGWGASHIQLLVEALDASGQPVDQRVVWLGSDLAAGAVVSLEASTAAAASHRVRVFAFSLDAAAGPR